MVRSLDRKKLKVGEFVLLFSPATLLTCETVHPSEEAANKYMDKLAKKQLHWQGHILEVKSMDGCTCHVE